MSFIAFRVEVFALRGFIAKLLFRIPFVVQSDLIPNIVYAVKCLFTLENDLLTQLRKYLASEDLDGMIVVTQRAVNLPATIYGKPVYLLSLNRLWGVALP